MSLKIVVLLSELFQRVRKISGFDGERYMNNKCFKKDMERIQHVSKLDWEAIDILLFKVFLAVMGCLWVLTLIWAVKVIYG